MKYLILFFLGKISTLKFVEHWPGLNVEENTGQKSFKKNDYKSTQFKFQQSFPVVTVTESAYGNFEQMSTTAEEVKLISVLK